MPYLIVSLVEAHSLAARDTAVSVGVSLGVKAHSFAARDIAVSVKIRRSRHGSLLEDKAIELWNSKGFKLVFGFLFTRYER